MVARKKPIGDEWLRFVTTWQAVDHDAKVKLAEQHEVTYDTAKHWISEKDTTPKEKDETGKIRPSEVVGEILMLRPKIALDFVSFDIETTNLKADFSVLLSACIKSFGQKPIVFRGDDYPSWLESRDNDSEIITDIASEVSRHAIIVTHYGIGFDIRYLRAKMIKYGLPPLPPMFGIDTYSIAKRNMLVSRRRLAALAEWLNLGKKTAVEGNLWLKATMTGDKQAMDEIVAHNIVDCQILERLATISFPYLRSIGRL